VKGYRGEDAIEKANTMRAYWVPGVINLRSFGRWQFAECTDVWDMEKKFEELVESAIEASADANTRLAGSGGTQPQMGDVPRRRSTPLR